ncbi:DUF2157 domain-containing protein [Puteibacter caeruleilacunae]|nr:DUF2157 domain-containing protein [Puteibacter caeruleilacunae]
MNLIKELTTLVDDNVISQETAERIQEYYNSKKQSSTNRIYTIFALLGALLVGLGIILIIAHNWDHLTKNIKTVIAFLPLILAQALCLFTLIRKNDNSVWRESTAVLLVFAIGACISLISQIYNIPGNLSSFLFTWALLVLPIIYLMRSSVTSLLYHIGIVAYAGSTCYWGTPNQEDYYYWLLLAGALPYYGMLLKNKPQSNFTSFHNWIIPLSVITSLGTVVISHDSVIYIAYFSLFAVLLVIGNLNIFEQLKPINNSYRILGSLGTVILLLPLSFEWYWKELQREVFSASQFFTSPEFIVAILLTVIAGIYTIKQIQNKKIQPHQFVFALFILTYILGMYSYASIVIINLIVFGLGLMIVWEGAKQNHLGILNYGMLILIALVACRFFDTSISFIIRGALFMIVGIGFFSANIWILKKRRNNE